MIGEERSGEGEEKSVNKGNLVTFHAGSDLIRIKIEITVDDGLFFNYINDNIFTSI